MRAISGRIEENNKVGPRHSTSLKLNLKRMLEAGTLEKVTGLGLIGSFKLAKVEKPKSPKKLSPKKPAAKKTATKKTVKRLTRT